MNNSSLDEFDKWLETMQVNHGISDIAMEKNIEAHENIRPDYLDENGNPHWFKDEEEKEEEEINLSNEEIEDMIKSMDRVNLILSVQGYLKAGINAEDLSNSELRNVVRDIYGLNNKENKNKELNISTNIKITDEEFSFVKSVLPTSQYNTTINYLNGEERNFFKQKIKDIAEIVKNAPKLYETDGQEEHPITLRYFHPSGTETLVTEIGENGEAFGFQCLNGDYQMAEWGYVDLNELKNIPMMEVDYYIEKGMSVERFLYKNHPDMYPEYAKFEKKTEEKTPFDVAKETGNDVEAIAEALKNKSTISEQEKTDKPYNFFINDIANLDLGVGAEIEPITGLSAEEATLKYTKLKEKGLSPYIGLNIPGDSIFDDKYGEGAAIFTHTNERPSFWIGDMLIKQLKKNDEHAKNVIEAYKELYATADKNIKNVEKPEFLFEKEKELFGNKENTLVKLNHLDFFKHLDDDFTSFRLDYNLNIKDLESLGIPELENIKANPNYKEFRTSFVINTATNSLRAAVRPKENYYSDFTELSISDNLNQELVPIFKNIIENRIKNHKNSEEKIYKNYDFTKPINISERFAIDFVKENYNENTVRFIDRKYNQITTGQYLVSTIAEHKKNIGLDLDGGVPAWKVDSEATDKAIDICRYYRDNNINITSNFKQNMLDSNLLEKINNTNLSDTQYFKEYLKNNNLENDFNQKSQIFKPIAVFECKGENEHRFYIANEITQKHNGNVSYGTHLFNENGLNSGHYETILTDGDAIKEAYKRAENFCKEWNSKITEKKDVVNSKNIKKENIIDKMVKKEAKNKKIENLICKPGEGPIDYEEKYKSVKKENDFIKKQMKQFSNNVISTIENKEGKEKAFLIQFKEMTKDLSEEQKAGLFDKAIKSIKADIENIKQNENTNINKNEKGRGRK